MCGICGIINLDYAPVKEDNLKAMMNNMRHRGPDDDGLFIDDQIGLGFVRLSIIDLTLDGHQPMFSDDKRYVIVFNGEIYNYIELRESLIKKGHTFKTRTDTEVLLKAYIEWGEECLDYFNGMWAFAIYDQVEKKLFATRDRYGIKPFYYFKDDNVIIFCSEIKSILPLIKNRTGVNNQTMYDYLLLNRTDYSESTFYENIHKLMHGHSMTIKNNHCTIKRWYNLTDKIGIPFKSSEEYRELLSNSIGIHLRSDVPVGVCFSGGLDSSSIVSLLLKDFKLNDIKAFSAVYGKGITGDESEYINEFKTLLKNLYLIFPAADELYKNLDLFMYNLEEPVTSASVFAQFSVMKFAKDFVKVLLDGQGADEQLAGYHYFFGFYYKELFSRLRWDLLVYELFSFLKNHRSLYALQSLGYLFLTQGIQTKLKTLERKYINRSFINDHSPSPLIIDNLYHSSSLRQSLINHFEFKLEHLLKWEDRNSMCFSIESRVPFLDYRLVEKTLALPSREILHKGNTKYILRNAMKKILPEKIRIRQSKIGFGTPADDWFKTTEFRKYITEILNDNAFKENPYIDTTVCMRLYQMHLDGRINIGSEIWKWINTNWFLNNAKDQVC